MWRGEEGLMGAERLLFPLGRSDGGNGGPHLILKRTPNCLVYFSSNNTNTESRMKDHKRLNPEEKYKPRKQVKRGLPVILPKKGQPLTQI